MKSFWDSFSSQGLDKETHVGDKESGKEGLLPVPTPPNQLGTLDPHWIDVDEVLLWLSTCDRDHPTCRKVQPEETTGTLRCPLWLVDIQLECIVPAEGVHREYLALSYVWGGVESAQLTHDTLTALQRPGALGNRENSVVAVVPKTIRHAMGLVGLLKQRYLWVDRFCICQDDAESKHSQLQAMADIYDGAYLTIVAASGRDADHGLHGLQGVTASRALDPPMNPGDYSPLVNPNWSVWYSRGWTFQEAVFSRRKIVFRAGMAMWQCGSHDWHEFTGTSGLFPFGQQNDSQPLMEHRHLGNLTRNMALPPIESPSADDERALINTFIKYRRIVLDYNPRAFTFPEDVHDAFLGVAKQLLSFFPQGVWCGLPVQYLDFVLLWQPQDNDRCLTRRQPRSPHLAEQRALLPSWSWMGWVGGIGFTWGIPIAVDSGLDFGRISRLCQWEGPTLDDCAGPTRDSPCLLRTRASVARIASVQPWPRGRWKRKGADPIGLEGMLADDHGLMRWTEDGAPHPRGRLCELIALAAFVPCRNVPGSGFFLLEIFDDMKEYIYRASPAVEEGEEICMVMAVTRENGTAYREGLGIIYKRVWDALNPVVEDVVLGRAFLWLRPNIIASPELTLGG